MASYVWKQEEEKKEKKNVKFNKKKIRILKVFILWLIEQKIKWRERMRF